MAAQDAQPFRWHYPALDDDNSGLEDNNSQLHGFSLLILLIVFVVVLFFTLLCLYIRWASRSLGPGGSAGPPGPNGRSGPRGLDPKVISSLPVQLLHRQAASAAAADGERVEGRDGEDSMTCSICLSTFAAEGEKVKVLPRCRHAFHPECVDEWLKTRPSCPLCRASIGQLQGVEAGDEMV